ncbi:MAG: APC family permease [Actinobacteria bacterium]|nr:APC family permease [Actinomycetota bacterium]
MEHTAGEAEGHSLQKNVLGMLDAVVMAVAGSAPAYSVAATTAVIIGAVGLASPAALLWCGIPMMGIAWAYSHLNRLEQNAGAAYAWTGRTLHPILGFTAGWAVVVSATIFMVAGSLPAGSVTLALFSNSAANNVGWVTAVGSIWFLVMAGLVALGVRITARAQWIMSSIEVGILFLFGIVALVHASTHTHTAFSWSWFWFSHFHGFAGFAAGALVAAFYYWGWDVASNLNEETENSQVASGIGGIIGVLIVFSLFEMYTVAVNMMLPAKTVQANSGDILSVLGNTIWSGPGGKILIIAVMLSTVATLETTLIQVTRTLFAMAREYTLPAPLGYIHRQWRTPAIATAVVAVVSLGLFIGSNYLGSLSTVLTDAISAIGLQIAIYYGLAGLTAAVAFRKHLLDSVSNFVLMGLWPLLGSAFMFWIFGKSIPSLGGTIDGVGLGAMGLGLIPLVWYWAKGSAYFKQRPTLGSVRVEDGPGGPRGVAIEAAEVTGSD